MITKKQYEDALQLIDSYKKQEEERIARRVNIQSEFPVGTFVVSSKNTEIRGKVIDYKEWNGIPQLILAKDDGSKTKVLITNATKI